MNAAIRRARERGDDSFDVVERAFARSKRMIARALDRYASEFKGLHDEIVAKLKMPELDREQVLAEWRRTNGASLDINRPAS